MKNNYFKGVCQLTSKNSTCARLQVGALLVKNDRILSIGYNGVAKGQDHCIDVFTDMYLEQNDDYTNNTFEDFMKLDHIKAIHGSFSNKNEIHAEMNCIGYAARDGIKTNECDLYVSISPCINCAKLIIAAGIKNIYYIEKYDRDTSGIELLKENNIECVQI